MKTNSEYLEELHRKIETCHLCSYGDYRDQNRYRAVPGAGSFSTPLMFIGEGPGEDEATSGQPFVGRAGQLLNSLLNYIGVPRHNAFITNVVKCRPPNNETPKPEAVKACLPFLKAQMALFKPRIVVLLGGSAVSAVLGAKVTLQQLRGSPVQRHGIIFFTTYHPAAVLRPGNIKEPDLKRDFDILRDLLGKYCPQVFENRKPKDSQGGSPRD